MKKLYDLNLAFTDIETTGLDANEHEIIEIATLVFNPRTEEIREWETKIAPLHIETASQQALRVNGYINNPGAYTTSLKSALIKFNSLTENCMIVGQNIDFDLTFIKRNMADLGIEPNFDRHRKLDLMSLVWFTVKDTEIPGLSLSKLCDHFGVSNVGAHSALIDCRRTFEIYRKLNRAASPEA